MKGGVEMKNCTAIKELLSLYIEGELDNRTAGEVKKHLRCCSSCYREMEDIKRLMEACRQCEDEELPDGFQEQLHKKLTAESEKQKESRMRAVKVNKYIGIGSSIAAVLIMAVIIRGIWFNSNTDKSMAFGKHDKVTANASDKVENPSSNAISNSAPSEKKEKENNTVNDVLEDACGSSFIKGVGKDNSFDSQSTHITSRSSDGTNLRNTLPARSYLKTNEDINISCKQPETVYNEIVKFAATKGELIDQNSTMQSNPSIATNDDKDIYILFKIKGSDFNEVKDALKSKFPDCEISFGNTATADITPEINDKNKQINEMTNALSSSDIGKEEADKIREEIESSKLEVSNMKNDSSYIFIKIKIYKLN
jgi:hypothetical protein